RAPARRTIRAADSGREGGGHPAGGRLGPLGPPHAGGAGGPPLDLLRVVSALRRGRRDRAGGEEGGRTAVLESHSPCDAPARRRRGAGRSRTLAARAGVAAHRPDRAFPLRIIPGTMRLTTATTALLHAACGPLPPRSACPGRSR